MQGDNFDENPIVNSTHTIVKNPLNFDRRLDQSDWGGSASQGETKMR